MGSTDTTKRQGHNGHRMAPPGAYRYPESCLPRATRSSRCRHSAPPATCRLLLILLALFVAVCLPLPAGARPLANLTAAERAWLTGNPDKLTLFFNTEFPPIEFSSESGAFVGLGADIIGMIEEQLGVTFHKKPSTDWNRHLEALKSGECAIAPTIVHTGEREKFAFFTKPYATVPVVIITSRSFSGKLSLADLRGRRVGVVSGYATEPYLRDRQAANGYRVVGVKNVVEGLHHVSFGQLDAFVENLAVAAYYIEQEGITNLRVAGKTDYAFAFRIAVSRQYPLLFTAIEKALNDIPAEELAGIRNQWISLKADLGMSPHTVWMLKLSALFTFLLLVSLAGMALLLKRRLNQKVAGLRDSERKFRLIFESFEDIYYQTDRNGIITLVSPSVYRLSGWTPEELIGQPADIVYEDPEDRTALLAKLKDQGHVRDYELTLNRRDGSKAIASLSAHIIYDEKNIPSGLAGALRDITDRKKAELQKEMALASLRESEDRYRSLFENAVEGVFQTTPDGRFLSANPSLARLLGFDSPQELMKTITNVANEHYENPGDRKTFRRIIESEGIIKNFETRLLRKDRTVIWASLSARTVRNDKGKVLYYEGTLEDITARKLAEAELKKSEERFRLFAELAPVGIVISDHGENVLYLNQKFIDLFGYTLEDMPSTEAWWTMAYPDETVRNRIRREWKAALDDAQKSGSEIKPLEYTVTCKDGAWRQIEFRIATTGELNVVVFTDVTERKRMEEEREKLKAQLDRAQKLESIGTLAGGIAHDFNNLLMGIQGHVSLMRYDLDSFHPHQTRLKHIEEQIRSASDLTDQLLGFARGGRYEVKSTNMNDLVEKTAAMFGRTRKEIVMHKQFREDLWKAAVDRSQMEQVFLNLYVNAWHAMPGGGEIFLETDNCHVTDAEVLQMALAPGKYVKVTVGDTGTGMDKQTLERIFDPFFTTKGMGRGTGLGLATVYGIIKGHEGLIVAASEPGHGTTFEIYLPATEKPVVREEEIKVEMARGTETILLVDDEPVVWEIARDMLSFLGYRVYGAGSGQEALAVYQEKKKEIDLVILDMIMPGISGGETFDLLREINPRQKVLLSSGYSINGEAREIMDRGCHGFLQKPFHLERLAQEVRAILDMHQVR